MANEIPTSVQIPDGFEIRTFQGQNYTLPKDRQIKLDRFAKEGGLRIKTPNGVWQIIDSRKSPAETYAYVTNLFKKFEKNESTSQNMDLHFSSTESLKEDFDNPYSDLPLGYENPENGLIHHPNGNETSFKNEEKEEDERDSKEETASETSNEGEVSRTPEAPAAKVTTAPASSPTRYVNIGNTVFAVPQGQESQVSETQVQAENQSQATAQQKQPVGYMSVGGATVIPTQAQEEASTLTEASQDKSPIQASSQKQPDTPNPQKEDIHQYSSRDIEAVAKQENSFGKFITSMAIVITALGQTALGQKAKNLYSQWKKPSEQQGIPNLDDASDNKKDEDPNAPKELTKDDKTDEEKLQDKTSEAQEKEEPPKEGFFTRIFGRKKPQDIEDEEAKNELDSDTNHDDDSNNEEDGQDNNSKKSKNKKNKSKKRWKRRLKKFLPRWLKKRKLEAKRIDEEVKKENKVKEEDKSKDQVKDQKKEQDQKKDGVEGIEVEGVLISLATAKITQRGGFKVKGATASNDPTKSAYEYKSDQETLHVKTQQKGGQQVSDITDESGKALVHEGKECKGLNKIQVGYVLDSKDPLGHVASTTIKAVNEGKDLKDYLLDKYTGADKIKTLVGATLENKDGKPTFAFQEGQTSASFTNRFGMTYTFTRGEGDKIKAEWQQMGQKLSRTWDNPEQLGKALMGSCERQARVSERTPEGESCQKTMLVDFKKELAFHASEEKDASGKVTGVKIPLTQEDGKSKQEFIVLKGATLNSDGALEGVDDRTLCFVQMARLEARNGGENAVAVQNARSELMQSGKITYDTSLKKEDPNAKFTQFQGQEKAPSSEAYVQQNVNAAQALERTNAEGPAQGIAQSSIASDTLRAQTPQQTTENSGGDERKVADAAKTLKKADGNPGVVVEARHNLSA